MERTFLIRLDSREGDAFDETLRENCAARPSSPTASKRIEKAAPS
jgi:hypothetical protein